MQACLFCRVAAGEQEVETVLADEVCVAFLDHRPVFKGHVLVIPKEPAETLDKLSDESAAAIGRVLPRLCRAVKRVTGVEAFNVLENNGSLAHQAVFHVHFHIIPKPNETEGLGVGWKPGKLGDGEKLAEELRGALGG